MSTANDKFNFDVRSESFREAISFVNRVNAIFTAEGTPQKFQQFLDYLIQYRQSDMTIPELVYASFNLFEDHLGLFVEFLAFVPRNVQIEYPRRPPLTDTTPVIPSTPGNEQEDTIRESNGNR